MNPLAPPSVDHLDVTTANAQPTLIGIPYDESSSFRRGAARAPACIRAALASESSNLWTESMEDLGETGRLADAGDIDVANIATARDDIAFGIAALLARGACPIALGGDHSVTLPIMRAFSGMISDLTLVQFDAHPDLYDAFDGDKFSHACQFARIMEAGLVRRLVQVGIRTMNRHQRLQADRFGVEVIDMRAWVDGVRPDVSGPVYVSIDMDCFDPAFAPGVSHREPGGLAPREVISVLQTLAGRVVGADIGEFNPGQDPVGLTAPLCAKLVKELASTMSRAGPA